MATARVRVLVCDGIIDRVGALEPESLLPCHSNEQTGVRSRVKLELWPDTLETPSIRSDTLDLELRLTTWTATKHQGATMRLTRQEGGRLARLVRVIALRALTRWSYACTLPHAGSVFSRVSPLVDDTGCYRVDRSGVPRRLFRGVASHEIPAWKCPLDRSVSLGAAARQCRFRKPFQRWFRRRIRGALDFLSACVDSPLSVLASGAATRTVSP